jgi:hypothetical protein
MTVHWSPGETLPARPIAVVAVLGALTLACAASFSAPLAQADRPEPHRPAGVHSITPVTDRWMSGKSDGEKHCAGPVRPP